MNLQIQKRKIHLIILAKDASDNTKKKYTYQSQKNKIPILIFGNKELLGRAIGKEYRALIGIKDKNMAINLINIQRINNIGGETRV
ncbi:ribosomal L7Ae/L30e/S12e/Gadd45-like protein [Garciella nitratireducens]|nr:ribosomal L7Ae/L30e/S12e/Gadd45-like protein [Garciella nitratireducens]